MWYVIYFVIGIGFAWWSKNKRPELKALVLLLRVIAWPIFLLRAFFRAFYERQKQELQRLDDVPGMRLLMGVPGMRLLMGLYFPGLKKQDRDYKRLHDHETYRQVDGTSSRVPEGDGHAGLDIKIPEYGPITDKEPQAPANSESIER